MDVDTFALATGAVQRISVPTGGQDITGTRTDGSTGSTVEQANGDEPAVDSDARDVAFGSNADLTGNRPPPEAGETPWESGMFVRVRSVPTVSGVSPGSMQVARHGQVVTVTGTDFTRPSAVGDRQLTRVGRRLGRQGRRRPTAPAVGARRCSPAVPHRGTAAGRMAVAPARRLPSMR